MDNVSRFHSIVWGEYNDKDELTPREVRRYIQLAGALEPLSEKEGCTTRSNDLNEFQKLEYFITAAINIGDAFEDLASRLHENSYPILTYDLAYRAQADSKKNRRGGRTNQGIIEFLFPIIISQCVNKAKDPFKIITDIPYVLQNTSVEDTLWLQKMQNLAFEMSGYSQRLFQIRSWPNILDYYYSRIAIAVKPSDVFHNREIVENYPTLRKMLSEYISLPPKLPLSKKMDLVYRTARESNQEIPSGILADLSVGMLYLKSSTDRFHKLAC